MRIANDDRFANRTTISDHDPFTTLLGELARKAHLLSLHHFNNDANATVVLRAADRASPSGALSATNDFAPHDVAIHRISGFADGDIEIAAAIFLSRAKESEAALGDADFSLDFIR